MHLLLHDKPREAVLGQWWSRCCTLHPHLLLQLVLQHRVDVLHHLTHSKQQIPAPAATEAGLGQVLCSLQLVDGMFDAQSLSLFGRHNLQRVLTFLHPPQPDKAKAGTADVVQH
jgi:hypothetical protein